MKSFNTLLLVAVLLFKQTHPRQREQQQQKNIELEEKKEVSEKPSIIKKSIFKYHSVMFYYPSREITLHNFFSSLSLFPTPAAARRTLSHTRSSIASLFCPRFFFLIPSSNNQTEQPSWLS